MSEIHEGSEPTEEPKTSLGFGGEFDFPAKGPEQKEGEHQTVVLVVEDNPGHLKDARAFFDPLTESGRLRVDYAETLEEAQALLEQGGYHGIISDVFYPIGESEQLRTNVGKGLRELMKPAYELVARRYRGSPEKVRSLSKLEEQMGRWEKEDTVPPSGVALYAWALSRDVPITLASDLRHHAVALDMVSSTRDSLQERHLSSTGGFTPLGRAMGIIPRYKYAKYADDKYSGKMKIAPDFFVKELIKDEDEGDVFREAYYEFGASEDERDLENQPPTESQRSRKSWEGAFLSTMLMVDGKLDPHNEVFNVAWPQRGVNLGARRYVMERFGLQQPETKNKEG